MGSPASCAVVSVKTFLWWLDDIPVIMQVNCGKPSDREMFWTRNSLHTALKLCCWIDVEHLALSALKMNLSVRGAHWKNSQPIRFPVRKGDEFEVLDDVLNSTELAGLWYSPLVWARAELERSFSWRTSVSDSWVSKLTHQAICQLIDLHFETRNEDQDNHGSGDFVLTSKGFSENLLEK